MLKLKIADYCIVYIALLAFGYMIVLGMLFVYPNGRDVWFHMLVSRAWYKGMNGMVSPVVMDINKLPYPPLYHLILTPFVANVETAVIATKVLQAIFYPLSLLLSMLVIRKYEGSEVAAVFGILLTGTYYAFGMTQARPQSLSTLMFPIAVWSLLERKNWLFMGSIAVMFYTHSPISIALSCGLLLYGLRKNLKDPKIWATIAVVAPIVLYQASFMFSQVVYSRWVGSGDLGILAETKQFMANPGYWLANALGFSMMGLPIILLLLGAWRKQSEFTKLMLFSFFGFLIILPIWYQRVFQFALIPLAFFTAQFACKQRRFIKYFLIGAFIIQVILFTVFPTAWVSPPPYLKKYW